MPNLRIYTKPSDAELRSRLTPLEVDAGPFTSAESYHQDYLQAHPDGYTCHYLRD